MEEPNTPNRPTGARDPAYTGQNIPETPISRFSSKRTRTEQHTAPATTAKGDEKRVTHQTSHALLKGIEAANRRTNLEVRVMQEYANVIDDWISQYKTAEEQEIADRFSKAVSDALITCFEKRTTSTTEATIATPVTYAKVAKATMNAGGKNPVLLPKQKLVTKPAAPQSRADIRILVTIPRTNLLEREEAFVLRKRIVGLVPGLTLARLPLITPTATGWAITPSDLATRDLLLESGKEAIAAALHATSIATPEKWYNYVVPNVPATFLGIANNDGDIETTIVDESLVREEVLAQTRITPVRVSPARKGVNPITGKQSWIVSFTKTVPSFYLFGQTSRARLMEKKASLQVHTFGCQSWCNPLKCSKARRCNHCGIPSLKHDGQLDGNCPYPAKCANCYGPYEAGHNNCLAAPKRQGDKLVHRSAKDIAMIRKASNAATKAAQASTISSPAYYTPSSSAGEANLTRNSSPSSTASKRARDDAVTRHELGLTPVAGSSNNLPKTATSDRPIRAAAPRISLNNRSISQNAWSGAQEKVDKETRARETRKSNRFNPLTLEGVQSATELQSDEDSELDQMDTRQ